MPTDLAQITHELQTQDNRATDRPIFLVQRKVRDYGYEPTSAEGKAYLNEYGGVTEEETEEYTGYRDRWEFVTACFTQKGCQDYIERNKHNLTETRIFAASSYRNEEYQTIYDWLYNAETGTNTESNEINKKQQATTKAESMAALLSLIETIAEVSEINNDSTEDFIGHIQDLAEALIKVCVAES